MRRIAPGGFEGWMRREAHREIVRFTTFLGVLTVALGLVGFVYVYGGQR